ncbi:outer membrane beta-barrel protein [Marinobacter salinisoli]|uniref:Outer membrane beta-barrel protein n=1 Tax=Marinobacter salinisoli TaxID=2769486 RepID=A0ABX7MR13_9GAMM|nr:outer membrane beta-barrel protein [Marinobacter salinisoli]QSP94777.1 outer membrane beta-barrel protein [Marinobacter salinisoli]
MKLLAPITLATLGVILAAVTGSRSAVAEENDAFPAGDLFPDKIALHIGAFSVFDSATSLTANGVQTGLGTTIDFERDLDGDTKLTTPFFDAFYRFNDRHRIELGAFQLDRKGNQSITREITFRNRTFTASAEVTSRIENTFYKVAYAYSFYHLDKVELAISAGFNVLDYEAELRGSGERFAETASTTAPMPIFGFRMDYSVTPRLTTRVRTDSFYFDFQDEIRGSLLELQIGAEYRLLDNLAIGGSLSRLAIDVEVNDDDLNGTVKDLYRGFRLYGALYF